jgi:hypothetical protein
MMSIDRPAKPYTRTKRYLSHILWTFFALLTLSGCATPRYVQVFCVTPAQLAELERARPGKIRDRLTG